MDEPREEFVHWLLLSTDRTGAAGKYSLEPKDFFASHQINGWQNFVHRYGAATR
jgi:hypothetical protein